MLTYQVSSLVVQQQQQLLTGRSNGAIEGLEGYQRGVGGHGGGG